MSNLSYSKIPPKISIGFGASPYPTTRKIDPTDVIRRDTDADVWHRPYDIDNHFLKA